MIYKNLATTTPPHPDLRVSETTKLTAAARGYGTGTVDMADWVQNDSKRHELYTTFSHLFDSTLKDTMRNKLFAKLQTQFASQGIELSKSGDMSDSRYRLKSGKTEVYFFNDGRVCILSEGDSHYRQIYNLHQQGLDHLTILEPRGATRYSGPVENAPGRSSSAALETQISFMSEEAKDRASVSQSAKGYKPLTNEPSLLPPRTEGSSAESYVKSDDTRAFLFKKVSAIFSQKSASKREGLVIDLQRELSKIGFQLSVSRDDKSGKIFSYVISGGGSEVSFNHNGSIGVIDETRRGHYKLIYNQEKSDKRGKAINLGINHILIATGGHPTYEGESREGKPHGTGRILLGREEYFMGEFNEGKPTVGTVTKDGKPIWSGRYEEYNL